MPSSGAAANGATVCAHAARPQAASTAKPMRRRGTPPCPATARRQGGSAASRQEEVSKADGTADNKANDDSSGLITRLEQTKPAEGGDCFLSAGPFDRKPGYKIHHSVARLTMRKSHAACRNRLAKTRIGAMPRAERATAIIGWLGATRILVSG